MSVDVVELTAIVPFGARMTGFSRNASDRRGAGGAGAGSTGCGAGGCSTFKLRSFTGSAVSSVGTTGTVTSGACTELGGACKLSGGASTEFDLLLRPGRPATTKPTQITRL